MDDGCDKRLSRVNVTLQLFKQMTAAGVYLYALRRDKVCWCSVIFLVKKLKASEEGYICQRQNQGIFYQWIHCQISASFAIVLS